MENSFILHFLFSFVDERNDYRIFKSFNYNKLI